MFGPRIAAFGRRNGWDANKMKQRGQFMEFLAKIWPIVGGFWTNFVQSGVRRLKTTSDYVLK